MIEAYLEDLERRVSEDAEKALWRDWVAFAEDRFEGDLFSPRRAAPSPPGIDWPHPLVNDTLDDQDQMALQQLETCSRALSRASGEILCVRCNYGTGILPSLFGVEPFVMARELDTLPTNRPLPGGPEALKTLLDRGVPDLNKGLGGKTLEMGQRFLSLFEPYPKIQRHVRIYHPDLQGPMDICELLCGSDLFFALVDEEELVLSALELITETYIEFMNAWTELIPFQDGLSVHWSLLHRGHIMLRDDSAMNLSPEMFGRFVRPFDQRLLETFGGGGLHYCGKGDHFLPLAKEMEGLYAVNLSQPEYNDMERVFGHTVDHGIHVVGLSREAGEEALARGRDLRGLVHCW